MRKGNRFLSGLIAITVVVGSFGIKANATDIKEINAEEVDSVYNMAVQSDSWEGWVNGPGIYSESGIVMDVDTGAVLYAKNIDDKHYPASITKVMTALVALQNYKMDETLTFTWDDIGFLEYGDAHIGIKDGEQISVEDGMYGMLLASANEVSHAIGAHMEGGYDVFIEEMNKTAAEIGCANSHWVNTHGLHNEEHYTSARDMALIGSAVFQYEKFREITATKQHTIGPTNITTEPRTFQQNHKMLYSRHQHYYEYCVGGKTGYTDQALTTLVTFATKDDRNLVAVVLRAHGGGSNAYKDTRSMLDYAFDNFTNLPVTKEQVNIKNVKSIEENSKISVPTGVTFEQVNVKFNAPTEKKDKTGEIVLTYNDQVVGSFEGTVTKEYYDEINGVQEEKKPEPKEKQSWLSVVLNIVLIVAAVLMVGMAVLYGYAIYRRKQREKRRRLRRMQYRKELEEMRRQHEREED